MPARLPKTPIHHTRGQTGTHSDIVVGMRTLFSAIAASLRNAEGHPITAGQPHNLEVSVSTADAAQQLSDLLTEELTKQRASGPIVDNDHFKIEVTQQASGTYNVKLVLYERRGDDINPVNSKALAECKETYRPRTLAVKPRPVSVSTETLAVHAIVESALAGETIKGKIVRRAPNGKAIMQDDKMLKNLVDLPVGSAQGPFPQRLVVPEEDALKIMHRINAVLEKSGVLLPDHFKVSTGKPTDFEKNKNDLPKIAIIITADVKRANIDNAIAYLDKQGSRGAKMRADSLRYYTAGEQIAL